jgi:aryl-alcohol dehydrogenase-like predicted oxidoreductase
VAARPREPRHRRDRHQGEHPPRVQGTGRGRLAETVEAFNTLHKAGKIHAVALSNDTGARITEWLGICRREGFEPPDLTADEKAALDEVSAQAG